MTDHASLLDAMRFGAPSGQPELHVQKVLEIVRAHLGLEIGFVSEFVDGRRVFRHIDAAAERAAPIAVGGSDPLEDSYCQRVVDGRLPALIHDACALPAALELPVTKALGVGAHVSVPLTLPDGRLYGTFCCFSFVPDASLNERDLRMVQAFAAITADLIHVELEIRRRQEEKRARIEQALVRRLFHIVYQPIFRLRDDALAGFEALTRFDASPQRPPDAWFNEAAEVDMAPALELAAIAAACEALPLLPREAYLTLNLSPIAIQSPDFPALFATLPLDRVILEVTEHAVVQSYEALSAALRPLRQQGLRVAVDDAGAGHASFRHVLDLRPDIIKLDMSITRDIAEDPSRHALATALTTFAHAMNVEIIAEGVETPAELHALRGIGVTKVQGYLLGRPLSLAEAAATPGRWVDAAREVAA
jgi:EAL domain-containing protein (putative c-di-GMP-specific phosphodiesterase class I)